MKFVSHSVQETKDLAKKLLEENLAFLSQGAVVFLLEGELGVGKTVFAQGIGEALGIKEPVTSASFVLEKEYPFEKKGQSGMLHHLDFWRFEGLDEVENMDLTRLFKPGKVVVIEWAEKGEDILRGLVGDRDDVKVVRVRMEDMGKAVRKFVLVF